MTASITEADWRAALDAASDDATLRMVYADWLEEQANAGEGPPCGKCLGSGSHIAPNAAAMYGTLAAWCGGSPCPACGRTVAGMHVHDPHCAFCDGSWRTRGVGPAAVAKYPLTRCVVTDREPRRVSASLGDGWTWSRNAPDQLPQDVYDLIPTTNCQPVPLAKGYRRWDTPAAALDALSAAMLAHARRNP